MMLHRPFIQCGILIVCLNMSYGPGAAAVAEAALAPEVQQKLASLKSGYESFVFRNVRVPYEQGVNALNARVKPALEREGGAAAARNDLDGLVRIKADIARMDKGQALTDTAEPPPEALKQAYASYKLELAKVEAVQQTGLADALKRYDTALAQVQSELTKAQDAAAALQVKQLREDLTKTAATAPPVQRPLTARNPDGLAGVEMSGEVTPFEEGAQPYTNRSYSIGKLNSTLRKMTFVKKAGGAKSPTLVNVVSPGKIYVACAEMEGGRPLIKDLKHLQSLGFEKTRHKFEIYNVEMVICTKDVDAPLTLDPAESFAGFLVIGRVSAKP